MPRVSIVMPVYNGERYLSEAIESILAQTLQDWELWLVDDCSSDSSPGIMRRYAERDNRIQVIRNPVNMKLPRALNLGFRHARGDYLTWTSDDNRYEPGAIETMADALDKAPDCGLVYCDMEYICEDGIVLAGQSRELCRLYVEDPIGACFLYRREILDTVGEYDPNMFLIEDYDYWLRISRKYPIKYIPKCVYQYRFHGGSLTVTRQREFAAQKQRLRLRDLDYLLEKADAHEKAVLFLDMWSYDRENIWPRRHEFFSGADLPEELGWLKRIVEGKNRMDDNKKIILFGAGTYGRKALEYFGADRVYCFADNNPQLWGKPVDGTPVISFDRLKDIYHDYQVVISAGSRIAIVLAQQLEEAGIRDYSLFIDMVQKVTTGSMKNCIDYVEVFQKAEGWMLGHSVPGKGIINNTDCQQPYPEVTGYFIPSLLRWGYRELALSYAKWLCSIQKEDGSWYDTLDQAPYVFDTAQILKGLLAVRTLYPEVDGHIKRGCDWLLSNMELDGRLSTPDQSLWDKADTSDLIHLYCLTPLYEAAKLFELPRYAEKADKIKAYYIENRRAEILNFDLLSHFYAYVLEGLCDLGETELVQEAMERVASLQREDGMVPAHRDVNWVCSTGLFQFALVWYKLGDLERGNRALRYACSLQNRSGGWYGSYATAQGEIRATDEKEYPRYFTSSEISWAVKYFFDALAARCGLEFEGNAGNFFDSIGREDGRYRLIREAVCKPEVKLVCDAGCGKGRYVRNLLEDTGGQDIRFSCVDISANVLKTALPADSRVEARQGTLTQMPYPDETFDVVYTCEALEHSVCVENALKELLRITRPGGKVIVIDKPKSAMGVFPVEAWEQWMDDSCFEKTADLCGCRLEIIRNLPYEDNKRDGLFDGWILHKCGKTEV